ncbi:hypothetical protein HZC09_03805 [Candidatus Micrarchaeota archaeon]|nr:hypothetical protein [Candidatus Micrarchaeota archaeon]
MFDEFLGWADEQGLPFREWADGLEEKGLPGWLPVAILLVILAVAAFMLMPKETPSGTVIVYAKTIDGELLGDVRVSVFASNGFEKSDVTGQSGRVVFESVPVGSVRAIVSGEVVLEPSSFDMQLKAGATEERISYSSLQRTESLVLQVDVVGAPAADLTLLDDKGKEVDFQKDVPSYPFSVLPNRAYTIKATAEGYLPNEKGVMMGEYNLPQEIVLQKVGVKEGAELHVRVVDYSGQGPVANASVQVSEAGRIMAKALSTEDGSVSPVAVHLGASVSIAVMADGFEDSITERNVTSAQEQVEVFLKKAVSAKKEGTLFQVVDQQDNMVRAPVVRVYDGSALKAEKMPDDGIAFFDFPNSGLSASVYKPGFLPVFIKQAKKNNKVKLEGSDANNSGAIKVFVNDYKGAELQGATVELLDASREPLGIPPRVTGLDGSQRFEDVPLEFTFVKATYEGQAKMSDSVLVENEENEFNATLVIIEMEPAEVEFKAMVLDHFSGAPVRRAKVEIGKSGCSTSAKGECMIRMLESEAIAAKVSAAGYDALQSSEFAVSPFQRERVFELFQLSVSAALKLSFSGVFDVSGDKVSSLSPMTEYEARYAMRSPEVDFAKAEAAIGLEGANVIGGRAIGARVTTQGSDSSASSEQYSETIQLTREGFYPSAFEAQVGASETFENADNRTHMIVFDDGQSITVKPGEKKNVVFNKEGSFGFRSLAADQQQQLAGFATITPKPVELYEEAKSVLFEFPKFSGAKELAVRFRSGKEAAVLKHRSAFFTEKEVLRDPSDGMAESGKFKVDFQGTCSDLLCLQYYFQLGDRKAKKMDVPLGKEAQLFVNVTGLEKAAVLVAYPSEAIEIVSARNAGGSASAVVSGNRLFVRLPAGESQSVFTIRAKRLSDDAFIKISVLVQNESIYEEDAFLRVYSKIAPSLMVKIVPEKVLVAMAASQVTFKVTDSLYDEPVSGARIMVGGTGGTEAVETASATYVAEVQTDSIEPVKFEVTKTGFKSFKASIAVESPADLVEVEPTIVAMSVDSREQTSSQLQATNRLSDTVKVSLSLSLDSKPSITDIELGTQTLTIKGKQTFPFAILAAIRKEVLAVASKANALKEDVRGTVKVKASAGKFTSERTVQFAVRSTFAQQALGDVWQLSSDSLSFRLEPPKTGTETQEFSVTNNGPHPLVLNVEQTLGLSVQPASLVLPANGQGTFVVKALTAEVDCFSANLNKQGTMTVYASFQGLSSKKEIAVSVDTSTASMKCAPIGGYSITLPVDLRLLLLPNSRVKNNDDGSNSIMLPTRELAWMDSGSSVTQAEAYAPYGTRMVFEPYRVSMVPNGGWAVSFPTAAVLVLPSDADKQPSPSGQVVVTLDNAQIILPQGTTISTGAGGTGAGARFGTGAGTGIGIGVVSYAGNVAVVPAGATVIFQRIPYNYDAFTEALPANPVEVRLPVDAVFELPAGTVERTPKGYNAPLPSKAASENLQNVKAVQLPGGERLAFSQDASISIETRQVRLLSGSAFYVSKERLKQVDGLDLQNAFELTLPLAYSLIYASAEANKPFKVSSGYALRLTPEASVEATWPLAPSRLPNGGFSLRVVRDKPLVYRKGASAKVPFDKSAVADCRLSFSYEGELSFMLPQGASVERAEGGFVATMPKCDETSKTKFYAPLSSLGSTELLETPSIKQLYFPASAEFTSGDLKDAEQKTVKMKGKVQFVPCLKEDKGTELSDSLKTLRLTFAEKTFVGMPRYAKLSSESKDVDFKQNAAVTFRSKNTAVQELGSTKKISIDNNGMEVVVAEPPKYDAYGLVFSEGAGMHFIPSCKKAARKLDVKARAEDVSVVDADDKKSKVLKVTFSNKDFKTTVQKKVCIYNRGKDVVLVDKVESQAEVSEPVERATLVAEIMDDATESAYFEETEKYGKKQHIRLDAEAKQAEVCHTFVFNFKLPEDALLDEDCIKSEMDTTSNPLKGKYVFKLRDVNNDEIAASDGHEIKAEITIDAKLSDCRAFKEQGQLEDLVQLSVNYDKIELKSVKEDLSLSDWPIEEMTFKAPDHERFFAIINNEYSPLKLEKIEGEGTQLMTCSVAKKGAPSLSPGETILPGSVQLLSCKSTRKGQGTYALHFSGGLLPRTKQIAVTVYEPEPEMAYLYQASSHGKVLPFMYDRGKTAGQSSAPAQSLVSKAVSSVTKTVTHATHAPSNKLYFAETTAMATMTTFGIATTNIVTASAATGSAMTTTGEQVSSVPDFHFADATKTTTNSNTAKTTTRPPTGSIYFADAAAASTAGSGAAKTTTAPAATNVAVEEKKDEQKTKQQLEEERRQKVERLIELENFRFCKTYFCNFQQASAAISSFMKSFSDLVESRSTPKEGGEPTLETLSAFCEKLSKENSERKLKKAMFLQLTNTYIPVDSSRGVMEALKNKWREAYFNDYGEVSFDSSASLSGCGFYELTASLDPACHSSFANAADWQKAMRVEIKTRKLSGCSENLANAPLFMADDQQASAGNRIGQGEIAALKDAALAIGKIPSVVSSLMTTPEGKDALNYRLETLGRLRQGTLGRYAVEPNEKDQKTLEALYAAMYNVDLKKKQVVLCGSGFTGDLSKAPCPAYPYDDAEFCMKTSKPLLTKLVGANAALLVVSSFSNVFAAGAIAPWVLPFAVFRAAAINYRFITALSVCTASYVASDNTCSALEGCTSGLVATLFDYAIGGFKLMPRELATVRGASTVATAFSAGASTLALTFIGIAPTVVSDMLAKKPSEDLPTLPLAYAARGAVSPEVMESTGFTAKRTALGILPGRRAVYTIENELWKRGVPRGEARKVAEKAAKLAKGGMLYGSKSKTLTALLSLDEAALMKVRSPLTLDPALELAKQLKKSNMATAKTILAESLDDATAKAMLKSLPVATQRQVLQEANLYAPPTPPAADKKGLAKFIGDLFADNEKNAIARAYKSKQSGSAIAAVLKDPQKNYLEQLASEKQLASIFTKDAGANLGGLGVTAGGRIKSAASLGMVKTADGKRLPLSLNGPVSEVVPSEVSAARTAGALRLLKTRRIAGGVTAVLSVFLFNTDFRPVQVRLNSDYRNHVVAYHSEKVSGEEVPTAASFCVGSDKQCIEKKAKTYDASGLCSSPACLKWFKLPQSSALGSYALVATFNNDLPEAKKTELLTSIFDPQKPPVADAPEFRGLEFEYGLLDIGDLPAMPSIPSDPLENKKYSATVLAEFFKNVIDNAQDSEMVEKAKKGLEAAKKGSINAAEEIMKKMRPNQ